MNNLKAGFARVDITPQLGYPLEGYYIRRYANDVLDPLYATAVAFSDSKKLAVVISLDAIGMSQDRCDELRKAISEKIGTEPAGVYICCTHTHCGLGFKLNGDPEYDKKIEDTYKSIFPKICHAAVLAVKDLKPSKLFYTKGKAEDVSFIRRFKMSDGSSMTNPGAWSNSAAEPLDKSDDTVSHLIIKREESFDIGIVNFQVHADVVGGKAITADFPHFVRDTYEKILDNTRCMYINGAEGDSNHIDIKLPFDHPLRSGYKRAEYMGRKIAMAAIANYELATPIYDTEINFGQKNIMLEHNKGEEEELSLAKKVHKLYVTKDAETAIEYVSNKKAIPLTGDKEWKKPAMDEMRRLLRIARLIDEPDKKEIFLTAIAVGKVAFAGFPGEPFTRVGLEVKENSPFEITLSTCCTNGYEGYYPIESAFSEGGYEALTATYKKGSAELLIKTSLELLGELYNN